MASLYRKKKTVYWWIRYRDPKTGQMRNESTKLRIDSVDETRKAKALRAEWEAKEFALSGIKHGEAWGLWVPRFLRVKYAQSPLTYLRSTAAWAGLSAFFAAKGIRTARLLTRAMCVDYIGWRAGTEGVDAGLRPVKHNTALFEIKFLSVIMREAVDRGFAPANIALQLGIKRARTKVKPEISDDEVEKIEAALLDPDETRRDYNEAMQIAWQIALLQVCRLTETCVPLRDVDLAERTITFRIKGGKDHTAMLHPDLVPLLTKLKADKKRVTAYVMPPNFAKRWFYFFRRHGLEHLSFHSTRVTGVTRLRRAGVDVRIAMDYVGHSSVLVHRIYQRQRREEQSSAVCALSRKPSTESPDAPSAT